MPHERFERIYRSIYMKLQGPEVIEWFPSFRCNSRCRYCGGYDNDAQAQFQGMISMPDVLRMVAVSAKMGTSMWNIGGRGGEPFLYSDLIKVLAAIKKHKMTGILITNGIMLDKQKVLSLYQIQWDMLRISLDSHVADVHDRIRGVDGNFETIHQALVLFQKLKTQQRKAFPVVIACPVITNLNYKLFPQYFDYCAQMGVDEVQLMPLIPVHDRARELMLSSQQQDEFVGVLEQIRRESRFRHNAAYVLSACRPGGDSNADPLTVKSLGSTLYCIHLWKTLVVSEDGYISPCSLIKDKLMRIDGGDMLKAWNSSAMTDLRSKILSGEHIDVACQECCGPLRSETLDFNAYLQQQH